MKENMDSYLEHLGHGVVVNPQVLAALVQSNQKVQGEGHHLHHIS